MSRFPFVVVNRDIIVGLLIVTAAVIWFFWGLAMGTIIYVWPPVLFLVGVIEIVRGFNGEA
jgi:hypothetical protein